MAVISSVRATYDELRKEVASNFINMQFVPVGLPFTEPVRMLKVHNFTDANLLISFDGVTEHDVMARNSDYVDDYCSNQALSGGGLLEIPAGKRFYAMGVDDDLVPVAPTTGGVCVTVIYADSH